MKVTALLVIQSKEYSLPGIKVNVYSTLVGVLLADLCEAQRTDPRRTMIELLSSGAAPGPVSSESGSLFGVAPASAPL